MESLGKQSPALVTLPKPIPIQPVNKAEVSTSASSWGLPSTTLLPAKGVHQCGKCLCPVETSPWFTGAPGSAVSANEKMGKHSELCTRGKMLVKSEFVLSTGCKTSIFCPCYCFAQCWQSFPLLYGTVRKFTITATDDGVSWPAKSAAASICSAVVKLFPWINYKASINALILTA